MNTSEQINELGGALAKAQGGYFMGHEDYPGYYITLDGRVYSCRVKRFLKPIRMGEYTGLQLVHARFGNVKRYLHRLILEFWYGRTFDGYEVRHLDGDRFNNSVSNLEWGTHTENMADSVRLGATALGERNGMHKLTAEDVRSIRKSVNQGAKQRSVCKQYGVSPMTISRAVRFESWRSI